jgi:hypothetical protein
MKRNKRIKQRERRRDARKSRELERALSEAKAHVAHVSLSKLAEMAASGDVSTRLLALMIARKQIDAGDSPGDYFGFARGLIRDRDNNCRWQAIFVIGESMTTDPDAVWRIIAEYGNSTDEDMRSVIGCALLEELLDLDFEKYFRLSQDQVLNGRHRFLDTIAMCWFNDRGPNWQRTQDWIDEARKGRP